MRTSNTSRHQIELKYLHVYKAWKIKVLPFTSNLRLFIMSSSNQLSGPRSASLYRSYYKYQFQIIDHKRIYLRGGRSTGGPFVWPATSIVDFLLYKTCHNSCSWKANINIIQECYDSDIWEFYMNVLNHRNTLQWSRLIFIFMNIVNNNLILITYSRFV